MILKSDTLASLLEQPGDAGLRIVPRPDLDGLRRSGSAAIDLRLGCWLTSLRPTRMPAFDVYGAKEEQPSETKLTKRHYVPFGQGFVLHTGAFILGVTLEWIRIPHNLAGYVVGKSSWGRRGLIIATATGVHPGFAGCLTLEITNVGEVPITIKPGTMICQVFLHEVKSDGEAVSKSAFVGRRRPTLGAIRLDERARRLAEMGP